MPVLRSLSPSQCLHAPPGATLHALPFTDTLILLKKLVFTYPSKKSYLFPLFAEPGHAVIPDYLNKIHLPVL